MWNLVRKFLGTTSPTELVDTTAQLLDPSLQAVGENIRQVVTTLYGGRSLRIRHVDAGSTNAEEFELTALGNAFYDIERFGIGFVASPRHADILTVSGPVTRNMEQALKTAYELMPEPRFVVAVGDGACTGGIWAGSYAVVGSVDKVIPVDLYISGDPPTPRQILEGLLAAIQIASA